MRTLILSGCLLAVAATSWAAPVDMTTTAGYRAACATVGKAAPADDNAARQAWVICRDTQLLKSIISFVSSANKTYSRLSDAALKKMVRDRLTWVRNELRTTRKVLDQIELAPGEGLTIAPDKWQLDLDGNGKLVTWERYFFAIPARGHSGLSFQMASDDPDYYARQYNLDAKIALDQADISWLLSYHYFAESLFDTVLAYTLNNKSLSGESIELVDPAAMLRARQLMVKGLTTSEKMRLSILAETDDNQEWIASERQLSSVFPVSMDDQDFKVWGELLAHMIPLFEGKTLLMPDRLATGILGGMVKVCPAGTGFNIAKFYARPPRYPVHFASKPNFASMCQRPDASHPASELMQFLTSYADRAEGDGQAGMRMLRQLLWVN
jgi:hypothetical protein